MTEVPVLETERRKNHINLINPAHRLLLIAVDCLEYHERERPSSEELCQRLAVLKESSNYRDSVEEWHDEIQAKDDQLQQLRRLYQKQLQQLQVEKEELLTHHNEEMEQQRRIYQEEMASREGQL